MSEAQVELMAEWAGGASVLTKFLKTSTAGHKIFKAALQYLENVGVKGEALTKALEAVEKAEPVVGVLEFAEKFNAVFERRAMIGLFLQLSGLWGTGLGDDPFEHSASSFPAVQFENKLATYGTVAPFEIGAAGFWWDSAKTLEKVAKTGEAGWSLAVDVYEVSHCGGPGSDCGPGYGNEYGSASGLDPMLYFKMYLLFDGSTFEHSEFTMPYDAVIFSEVQPGLRGTIDDK